MLFRGSTGMLGRPQSGHRYVRVVNSLDEQGCQWSRPQLCVTTRQSARLLYAAKLGS